MRILVRAPRAAASRLLLAQVVLLFACHAGARAQNTLQPGTRLRVETSEGRYTGTLLRRSADTLFLRASPTPVAIPVRDILAARESLGLAPRSALVMKGGLRGGAFGAVFGAIFLGLVMEGRTDAGPALFGASLGAATGGLLAFTERRKERWRAVEVLPGPP